jgi:hypothetical protein
LLEPWAWSIWCQRHWGIVPGIWRHLKLHNLWIFVHPFRVDINGLSQICYPWVSLLTNSKSKETSICQELTVDMSLKGHWTGFTRQNPSGIQGVPTFTWVTSSKDRDCHLTQRGLTFWQSQHWLSYRRDTWRPCLIWLWVSLAASALPSFVSPCLSYLSLSLRNNQKKVGWTRHQKQQGKRMKVGGWDWIRWFGSMSAASSEMSSVVLSCIIDCRRPWTCTGVRISQDLCV